MNCLIIAAGHGSPAQRGSRRPNLLPQVAGVTLIERVIRAAAAGGASRFTVVTGHAAEQVEAFLATLSDFPIQTAYVENWDLPNGNSVIAGARRIEGDYLLTDDGPSVRSRHRGASDRSAARPPLTLAVDRDLANPLHRHGRRDQGRDRRRTARSFASARRWTDSTRSTPACSGRLRRWPKRSLGTDPAASLSDGVQNLADQGRAPDARCHRP